MTILVKSETGSHRFQAKKGENLLEALLKNGVVLPHPCRGKGKCAKCRVGIAVLNEQESPEAIHAKGVNRLACLTEIREPLVISLGTKGSIVSGMTDRKRVEKPRKKTSPPSKRKTVMIRAIAQSDLSLWERLVGAFDGKDLKALEQGMESVLPGLRELIPEDGGPVTLVRAGSRLFGLYKGEANGRRYGLACHFEKEKLSGVLADLNQGQSDWFVTLPFHGSNRDVYVSMLKAVVEVLCKKAGCTPADVTDVVVAGQIPILEMLAGINESTGGTSALPAVLSERFIGSEQMGLKLAPHAVVYLPPARSAIYGADCVMAALAGGANPTGVMAGTLACLMDADSRKAGEKRG